MSLLNNQMNKLMWLLLKCSFIVDYKYLLFSKNKIKKNFFNAQNIEIVS